MARRNWCFTLNNPEAGDFERLLALDVKYIVVGKEVGDSGTPHLQGYVELNGLKRMGGIKAMIGERAHLEGRRGTPQQAADYCKKEGDFEERGTLSSTRSGYRNDLDNIRRIADEEGMRGVTLHATAQQRSVAMAYLTYHEVERDFKPEVTWLWGRRGAGKTRLAREMAGDDVYMKNGTKWWDRYDRHEAVIIDDFRPENMAFDELLRVLDRYPHAVEVKGGFRQLLAKRIIITAPKHPQDLFRDRYGEDIEQLLRRIDVIREITRD